MDGMNSFQDAADFSAAQDILRRVWFDANGPVKAYLWDAFICCEKWANEAWKFAMARES